MAPTHRRLPAAPAAAGDGMNGYSRNKITESTAVPDPAELKFTVTLNNQMARVFHGGGTVVQFKVGGKLLAVQQAGYSELQNAIVPPRNEQQIVIYGPALSQIPASGTLGVFLYDVVTDQNDAGVVTAKANFQWFFDYKMESRTATGRPTQVQNLRMSRDQWETLKAQQETPPQ
jgi:hypothetical protein